MNKALPIIFIIMSFSLNASIKLTSSPTDGFEKNMVEKSETLKINRVKIQKNQIFDISEDGRYLGTILPAEGYYNDIEPLCFIGWSSDRKDVSDIKISIGRGFFETVTCLSLDAVGKIEVKGRTFIGFVYTVALRDRTAQNYFLLELDKERKVIIDVSNTIEKLQFYSEKKSIIDLRKYLEENQSSIAD